MALLLGQFSTTAEMNFRRQGNTLHTAARETGNLVGLTQHMPHTRLPGTCPATQGSEAIVWTSEHRHESAGGRAEGLYRRPCVLPNTGRTGVSGRRRTATSHRSSKGTPQGSPMKSRSKGGVSHLSAVRSALSFSDGATSEALNTGTILPPTLSAPAGWSEAENPQDKRCRGAGRIQRSEPWSVQVSK